MLLDGGSIFSSCSSCKLLAGTSLCILMLQVVKLLMQLAHVLQRLLVGDLHVFNFLSFSIKLLLSLHPHWVSWVPLRPIFRLVQLLLEF